MFMRVFHAMTPMLFLRSCVFLLLGAWELLVVLAGRPSGGGTHRNVFMQPLPLICVSSMCNRRGHAFIQQGVGSWPQASHKGAYNNQLKFGF